jgi:hypothetical protein
MDYKAMILEVIGNALDAGVLLHEIGEQAVRLADGMFSVPAALIAKARAMTDVEAIERKHTK